MLHLHVNRFLKSVPVYLDRPNIQYMHMHELHKISSY